MQTPRAKRPLLAVLASLAIAAGLVGACSSSKQNSGPLPDPKTLLTESSQTTKTVKSVHMVLTVTGKIKGLPVKTLTGDITNIPNTAAKGNARITVAGEDLDADFVVLNGELFSNALPPHNWSDFGQATELIKYDPSTILDPNTGLANLLANFTNAKADGRETINGQNTIRITGTVWPQAVNKLAGPFDATQPVPATAWIQETGDHQLVQASLQKDANDSVQLTLSNWNQSVEVTKPPVSG
jgi:lipoprotein LprG